MADYEKNLPPRTYHVNDPDGIFALWKEMVGRTTDAERVYAAAFEEIVDPDTAPIPFVELMLAQLGNPFSGVYLTDTQKRKLVSLLVPMYRQKGTLVGIVNAVRFLTGIQIEIINPHGNPQDGWHVGRSEIGRSTYSGGRRVYSNLLSWTEAFDNVVWSKSNMTVTPDDIMGPAPWGRPADKLNMSALNAAISQAKTPVRIAEQSFTGSVWLKASAPASLTATISAGSSTSTTLNVTTNWQRFVFSHQAPPGVTGDARLTLYAAGGFAPDLWAFGAQLIRSAYNQPYAMRTNDGDDYARAGAWAYHFFIQSPIALSSAEDGIIRTVADFMKPAHTHYRIIDPFDPGFVDHWEVGLSMVGVNNYVHS